MNRDLTLEGLYWSEGFTIIPRLRQLRTPTLIIHGDYDFVPVLCATHIAEAIPGACVVVLEDSGHFSYIDAPDEVHKRSTSSSPAPDSLRGQEQQALPRGRTAAPVMIGKKYKLYSTA